MNDIRLAIVEYKTSNTAYVINSVINLNSVTAKDLEDTRNHCESRGGYFKIKDYKKI